MSAEAGNAAYRIALPEFEGPLDLLLHLCKTHELDIVNIPIAFVTEKYLEYLEVMESMSVDVAADYLVMAATLAYLKSRELVPSPEPLEATTEDGEPELDPREELIRRLLEYRKYKDAAEQLGGRPIEGRTVFGRGAPVEVDGVGERPLAEQSVWKLIEAFGKILEKTGQTSTHDVVVDRVSIGARINQLVDRMEGNGGFLRFDACFDLNLPQSELRNQVVVTLLAILELARLKVVRVLQSPTDETLFITQIEGTSLDTARRAHVTSDNLADGAPVDEPIDEAVAAEQATTEHATTEQATTEQVAAEQAAERPTTGHDVTDGTAAAANTTAGDEDLTNEET